MVTGLDYSYSHPDVDCAARAGFAFVARYIGDPDPNSAKYLDAPELARIRNAGLSVVVVRETTAGFMIGGDGAAHARASRAHCDQLGLHGIPIYYALDVDPRGLSAAQNAQVTRFLQDAAAADGGGHNVGIYAGHAGIERWAGQPFCWWGWQTYAWSAGRISSKAHFRQYLNGQRICGGTVDLNETYTPDFGQWPRPAKHGGPVPHPTPNVREDDDMPYLFISRWTGVHVVDGSGATWVAEDELAGVAANNFPRFDASSTSERFAREYLRVRAADTDELLLDQERAQTLYTAAVAQIEGREEQRDLADG